MNPCLLRCVNCAYSEELNKRLKCTKGFFDVKINDGILLVPYDYECVDFSRKENCVILKEE